MELQVRTADEMTLVLSVPVVRVEKVHLFALMVLPMVIMDRVGLSVGASSPSVEEMSTRLLETGVSYCVRRYVLLRDDPLYVRMIKGPLLTASFTEREILL